MKLLILTFCFFAFLPAAQDLNNDIFGEIIEHVDSLKTLGSLNVVNQNFFKLTKSLMGIYKRFDNESIMYDIDKTIIFPDEKIEKNIVDRYSKASLRTPLIMYTFFPSIFRKNCETSINDSFTCEEIPEAERIMYNRELCGKKIPPVTIYPIGYSNKRNIKLIKTDLVNFVKNIDYIESIIGSYQKLIVDITQSAYDYDYYDYFGKCIVLLSSIVKNNKIKIRFKDLNIGFLYALNYSDIKIINIISNLIREPGVIQFFINARKKSLVRYLLDSCTPYRREKYLTILCASTLIEKKSDLNKDNQDELQENSIEQQGFLPCFTSIEKLLITDKSDILKIILNHYGYMPIYLLSHQWFKYFINKNSDDFVYAKRYFQEFFNAIDTLSDGEQQTVNKIFNYNLKEKHEQIENILKKNETLRFRTKFFEFLCLVSILAIINRREIFEFYKTGSLSPYLQYSIKLLLGKF